MKESSLVRFVFVLCLVSSSAFCLNDSDQNANDSSAVYIVTLKDLPSSHSSSFKHSLTSTSSQIYKTLYVEKSYLFFPLSSFNLYPGFDFISQNFVRIAVYLFFCREALLVFSQFRHKLKFVNFGSQITCRLCIWSFF